MRQSCNAARTAAQPASPQHGTFVQLRHGCDEPIILSATIAVADGAQIYENLSKSLASGSLWRYSFPR
jgi:hypothetical protein